MKILILGSNGILGSALSPYLEKKGHKIYNNFRLKKNLSIKNEYNFCIKDLLKNKKIDCIINLAAMTNLNLCEQDLNSAYYANVYFLEEIISLIIEKNIHLIQISTDQVYSGEGPHKENKVSPLNVYALTKYMGELIAAKGFSTILRTNYVGKSSLKSRTSLVDWIYESFLKKNKIKLFNDIIFSPLHTYDLCKCIDLVINNPIKGTYNLGTRNSISKANFALELASKLGFSTENASIISYKKTNPLLNKPSDMSLNVRKFESVFKCKLPSILETINKVSKDFSS